MASSNADKELQALLRNNPDLQVEPGYGEEKAGAPTPVEAASLATNTIQSLPKAPEWTKAERDFSLLHLEPRLEDDIAYYHFQHEMRMPGHKYTADFFVFRWDGVVEIWEIKGKAALGSQGRSSSNFRWTMSQLAHVPHIEFYWAGQLPDGSFKITRKRSARPKNPIAR